MVIYSDNANDFSVIDTASSSVTYNNAGYSYNQAGAIYGGIVRTLTPATFGIRPVIVDASNSGV